MYVVMQDIKRNMLLDGSAYVGMDCCEFRRKTEGCVAVWQFNGG